MYTRHDEVPVFEYQDGTVDALYYNTVQTSLKRLGKEIRLSIPKLRSLDLILQSDAWIEVDSALNDVPIAVWTQFESDNREALHHPVKCQLRLFHANANIIINRVLEAMELLLGERLNEGDISHTVINFPEKE